MKKQLLALTAFAGIALSAPKDSPIDPWEYQKLLGHGFDVAWAEFKVKIEGYGVDEISAMKEHRFKTARIRTNLPADQTLFDMLDVRINDCLDSGIVPILAYQGGPMEADPSEANQALAVEWWRTVAAHYADYSHKLAFNVVVEWTEAMSKEAVLVNGFYEKVTPAIRESNPTRITIYSPKRISNPEYLDSMVIPQTAGNYVMAEWHFYAAGPSEDPTSPKYWTTGTDEQKKLITDKVKFATDWSAKNNIPTWVGAWMAGNYNKGNTTSMATQIGFAAYMTHVLDSVNIPWCINTIDKYYDYTTNMWIDSMTALRDTIDGISSGVVSLSSKQSVIQPKGFTIHHNCVTFTTSGLRTIELFNSKGQKLFTKEISGSTFEIPEGFATGIYALRVIDQTGSVFSSTLKSIQ